MKAQMSLDNFMIRYAAAPEERKQAAIQVATQILDGENTGTPAREPISKCLTITAAAEEVGVSRQTLYRAIDAGVLIAEPLYPGGAPKIREKDLRVWIDGRDSEDEN